MDVGRLIRLVNSRPQLWKTPARYNAEYFKLTNKLWIEIGKRLGVKARTAKLKWQRIFRNFRTVIKNATQNFTIPFNKNTYVSRNTNFNLLSFLLEDILSKGKNRATSLMLEKKVKTINSSKNHRKIPTEDETLDEMNNTRENDNVQQLDTNVTSTPNQQLIRVKPEFACDQTVIPEYTPVETLQYSSDYTRNRTSAAFNITTVNKLDDDYLFLMSCLSKLSSLSPSRNMFVRYQIQEVLYKEFSTNENIS